MNLPQRKSPRRSDYDYASSGGYFITICTKNRQHYFGEIIDGKICLNELWKICEQQIKHIEVTRSYVEIREYIIMPNHIHLLLILWTNSKARSWYRRDDLVGRQNEWYINENGNKGQATSLSLHIIHHDDYFWPSLWSIIWIFKSNVTKHIQKSWVTIPYWDRFARQSRYHDHIIRNEKEYNQIKYYIQTNPQNRELDTFNQ